MTLLTETESGLDADEAELYLAASRCHAHAADHRDAWRRLMRATELYRSRGDGRGMSLAALAEEHGLPHVRASALLAGSWAKISEYDYAGATVDAAAALDELTQLGRPPMVLQSAMALTVTVILGGEMEQALELTA